MLQSSVHFWDGSTQDLVTGTRVRSKVTEAYRTPSMDHRYVDIFGHVRTRVWHIFFRLQQTSRPYDGWDNRLVYNVCHEDPDQ